MLFKRRWAVLVLALALTLLGAVLNWQRIAFVQSTPQTKVRQTARISEDQAIALAVNNLQRVADGYELKNPRHRAHFGTEGITITPRKGKLSWRWQLSSVGSRSGRLSQVQHGPVSPQRDGHIIRYMRGGVVEQYVLKKGSIEQQFIIPEPLKELSGDLVITGKVTSEGEFVRLQTANAERTYRWAWESSDGTVSLGDVTVLDAAGAQLPAKMQVSAAETRIEIPESALAQAAYPITVDPEIGANDFRISDMGPEGNDMFDASKPAVAFNSADNQYLVVWSGDDGIPPLVDEEFEIFGQLLNADGSEDGNNDFRISNMGMMDGETDFGAFDPAVAYDSTLNQYLVVWEGDDDTGMLVAGEFEIFGQLLDANGNEIGTDFRISDMGTDGNSDGFDALDPAVAYNSTFKQYLVVWQGDDDRDPLVDNEFEIFGQLLNADGSESGTDDFRISDMGTDGNSDAFDALDPAVVYNNSANEYLVVWRGDDDTAPLVEGEEEIFGQLLDADGSEIGTDDFRISDMGPDGNQLFDAFTPAVAYNNSANEYLVVWQGDDLVAGEEEIYGQLLNADGSESGTNDFRISDMGPDGDPDFDASSPAVAYNSAANQYLVVWVGDDDRGPLVDNELEIFGQLFVSFAVAQNGLFISEYVEGSSLNKAIEIVNGTGTTIDLSEFRIAIYSDGSTTVTSTIDLDAVSLSHLGVFVLSHSAAEAAILNVADQTSSSLSFDGNDVVALQEIAGTNIDVIGQIGDDPGTEWGSGLTSTQDHTLRRKSFVNTGDPDGSNAFDPAAEWDGFAQDTFDGLGSHTIDNPLPVELTSFTYSVTDGIVKLIWTTDSETNNFGFEIERSEDEIDFQKIGFVKGKGTNIIPQRYDFVDENLAPSIYYYRLKQIDLDGAFEYSDAINVTVAPPKDFALAQNYPNPFNPTTTIRYDLPVSSHVVLTVYNILGKEVKTLVDVEQSAGIKTVVWDGTNKVGEPVSSGVYIYRLKARDFHKTLKLMMLK